MDKVILTAQELLDDSFRLGIKVIESQFEPTLLVAIWRGGASVAVAIHELMVYQGFKLDHTIIKASSYAGTEQSNHIVIDGMNNIIDRITKNDRLLIVDDIFDTGRTIVSVLQALREGCGENTAEDIRVATPWYKPAKNNTDIIPDYYLHTTDKWVVFPHELDALTEDEIAIHRSVIS